MAGIFNYTWVQGEDLDIQVTYKKGDPTPTPVDLTGWTLRLAIGKYGEDPEVIYKETDPGVELGADGTIDISLDKSALLEGGSLYDNITGFPSQATFEYDLFVRDAGGKPFKVLRGQIYIERSINLEWT